MKKKGRQPVLTIVPHTLPQDGGPAADFLSQVWSRAPLVTWPLRHLQQAAPLPVEESLIVTPSGVMCGRLEQEVALTPSLDPKVSVTDMARDVRGYLQAGDRVVAEEHLLHAVMTAWGNAELMGTQLVMQRHHNGPPGAPCENPDLLRSEDLGIELAGEFMQTVCLRLGGYSIPSSEFAALLQSSRAVFTMHGDQPTAFALHTPLGNGISLMGQSFARNEPTRVALFNGMATAAHVAVQVKERSTLLAAVDTANHAQCWTMYKRGFEDTGVHIKTALLR